MEGVDTVEIMEMEETMEGVEMVEVGVAEMVEVGEAEMVEEVGVEEIKEILELVEILEATDNSVPLKVLFHVHICLIIVTGQKI